MEYIFNNQPISDANPATSGGFVWNIQQDKVVTVQSPATVANMVCGFDVLGFAFGEVSKFESFGAGATSFFDLMQFFRKEKFIGIDQEITRFFVFGDNFFEGQGCIRYVGFLALRKGATWVKVVIGVDLAEL